MTANRQKARKGGQKGGHKKSVAGAAAKPGPAAQGAAAQKKEEAAPVVKKDPDEHPWAPGAVITVLWSDGSERFCDVIERQPDREQEGKWRYYVHYHDFNRRMDEWVSDDRLVKIPTVAAAALKARGGAAGHGGHGGGAAGPLSSGDGGGGHGDGGDGEAGRGRKRRHPGDGEVPDAPTVVADMDHDEHEGMDEASLKEHEEVTKIKNVERVELGDFRMETWYFSPFPKELFPEGCVSIPYLYFCEYTFKFFARREELARFHRRHRFPRHPPGQEIYREGNVSVFEVDGLDQREYCQNLSYFAKLFLDHKTLYYDVDPFLFYVVCESDDRGYHPVGYYSKEKHSDLGYNLACILTFPCHQRKGYGRFIIAFSYELSKRERKVGSPEKPLSDLGAVSYRSYWCRSVLLALRSYPQPSVSVMDLSKMTSIVSEDVINALQFLGLLKYFNGSHIVVAPPQVLDELLKKYPAKGLQVDPERLHWSPYVTPEGKADKWNISAKKPITDSDK